MHSIGKRILVEVYIFNHWCLVGLGHCVFLRGVVDLRGNDGAVMIVTCPTSVAAACGGRSIFTTFLFCFFGN